MRIKILEGEGTQAEQGETSSHLQQTSGDLRLDVIRNSGYNLQTGSLINMETRLPITIAGWYMCILRPELSDLKTAVLILLDVLRRPLQGSRGRAAIR